MGGVRGVGQGVLSGLKAQLDLDQGSDLDPGGVLRVQSLKSAGDLVDSAGLAVFLWDQVLVSPMSESLTMSRPPRSRSWSYKVLTRL